jgi:hypothetical protein
MIPDVTDVVHPVVTDEVDIPLENQSMFCQ